MEIDSCFDYLSDNESRDILRKSFSLLHMLIKIVAINILGDDVDVSFTPDSLLILNYLWMRNYLHDFALIVEGSYGNTGKLFSAYVLQSI